MSRNLLRFVFNDIEDDCLEIAGGGFMDIKYVIRLRVIPSTMRKQCRTYKRMPLNVEVLEGLLLNLEGAQQTEIRGVTLSREVTSLT
jgi:hypothetical protein